MRSAPAGVVAGLACPLCKSVGVRLFEKNNIWITDCSECGHRYADYWPPSNHVQETYDDSYFLAGGAGYPDYLAMSELMQERGMYYASILRRYGLEGARICDIGAASGSFLQGLAHQGFHCTGLEPNPRMVRSGVEAFGLDLRQGQLETFVPKPGECFDCVLLIQVVAHLVNPVSVPSLAARILRRGGLVVVETWDRRSATARIAGRRWHEYSPPSVLQFFDRRSLDRMFTDRGFVAIGQGRPPKPIQGSHLRTALLNALGDGAVIRKLVKLVPESARIMYPGNDVFWAIFRYMGAPAEKCDPG